MEVQGILGVLILLADVYAILQIAGSSAENGKKALWIVLVLLLPIIGVIIWYLAGPGRPS
ncbi:MAG: PLD nuclease N-terminal domain-containing protein [Gammaproteobacteria bacterium]|nr:PLD nuclease N-terminal domain-containing protein [Gammaproteobacteria bacterium]MDH4313841.1 PLD nuclease N-terminal domain-containing protein [Gammaproteobacteria bacterium]MDH5213681.1 PLD nuclease N-terminal domain-containing protein [Gammaproteobacteria bacterium]